MAERADDRRGRSRRAMVERRDRDALVARRSRMNPAGRPRRTAAGE